MFNQRNEFLTVEYTFFELYTCLRCLGHLDWYCICIFSAYLISKQFYKVSKYQSRPRSRLLILLIPFHIVSCVLDPVFLIWAILKHPNGNSIWMIDFRLVKFQIINTGQFNEDQSWPDFNRSIKWLKISIRVLHWLAELNFVKMRNWMKIS